jgi:hypothetical protein
MPGGVPSAFVDGDNQSSVHAAHHNALADALGYASYLIYKDGSNAAAISPSGLYADVAANADFGAVLQSCITNLGGAARGLILIAPGTYTNSSVAAVPRTYASGGSDDKLWTRILGAGGVTITLTSGGPRLLDMTRVADYDGFCGIEIGNLKIDANSVASVSNIIYGSKTEVVNSLQRVDYRRHWVHDIEIVNVPVRNVALGGVRMAIWLQNHHLGAAEGTWNYVDDIKYERIRMAGGNGCILAAGLNTGGSWLGTRIWASRIVCRDIIWDSGVTPNDTTGNIAHATGIQLGGGWCGDDMLVENCDMRGCGDNAYELNSLKTIVCRNSKAARMLYEMFFHNNFNYVNGVDASEQDTQTVLFEDCVGIQDVDMFAADTNAYNRAFELHASSCNTGTVRYVRCKNVQTAAQTNVSGIAFYVANNSFDIREIVMEDCTFDSYFPNATASNWDIKTIWMYRGPKKLTIRNLKINLRGAESSTGVNFHKPLYLNGPDMLLDIDGVEIIDNTVTRTDDTTQMVVLGAETVSGTNVISGRIAGLRFIPGGDATPRGVTIYGTANLTLRKLLIERANFSALSGDGGLTYFLTGDENKQNVFVRNFIERTRPPAEITFTPGATTVAAQYLGIFSGLMTVTGGTVTVVEVSSDGGTNYRQVASATNCAFYVENGWRVRMTYSSAPTCRVQPLR